MKVSSFYFLIVFENSLLICVLYLFFFFFLGDSKKWQMLVPYSDSESDAGKFFTSFSLFFIVLEFILLIFVLYLFFLFFSGVPQTRQMLVPYSESESDAGKLFTLFCYCFRNQNINFCAIYLFRFFSTTRSRWHPTNGHRDGWYWAADGRDTRGNSTSR